jgi:endonuclease YncB( thermonuclease family)
MRHGTRPRKARRRGGSRDLNLLDAVRSILVLAGLGLGALYLNAPSRADGLTGYASVIDGDTVEINGRRIRLEGIDAPEGRQICTRDGVPEFCGQIAAKALAALIGGSPIECRSKGEDQYGRMLGVCFRGDFDINREMVRSGNAVAYTRYAWRYIPHEVLARLKGWGIWGTEFINPEAWRHSR